MFNRELVELKCSLLFPPATCTSISIVDNLNDLPCFPFLYFACQCLLPFTISLYRSFRASTMLLLICLFAFLQANQVEGFAEPLFQNLDNIPPEAAFQSLAKSIVQECHATFTACFHAFFPTASLKWACLCELLGLLEPVSRTILGKMYKLHDSYANV